MQNMWKKVCARVFGKNILCKQYLIGFPQQNYSKNAKIKLIEPNKCTVNGLKV